MKLKQNINLMKADPTDVWLLWVIPFITQCGRIFSYMETILTNTDNRITRWKRCFPYSTSQPTASSIRYSPFPS